MTPTPRTDDHAQIAFPSGAGVRFIKGTQEEPGYLVSTDFARTLERENAALRAIIDATISALPVGNVRTHTPDSIPERVGDLVKAHADELADNEQLRKDKARLDWLAEPKNTIGNVSLPLRHVMNNPDSIRAAIDAAMEGDK